MAALAGVVLGLAVAVAGVAMWSVPAAVLAGGLLLAGLCALFVDVKPKEPGR